MNNIKYKNIKFFGKLLAYIVDSNALQINPSNILNESK